MTRPDRDHYYMDIARAVSKRGTCSRAQVGAIVVCGDVIVSTGYNGAPRGSRHCNHGNDGDMDQGDGGHCSRAVHAEANTILNAARNGATLLGGVLYVTVTPCFRCAPLIVQAGIVRVVIGGDYRPDPRAFGLLSEGGVEVVRLP